MPAQQLKGKSVGIGGSSDLAARAFLNELKLAPDNDVAILQFGGSTESAAAFDTGRIVVFPAPAGLVYLTQGMPHRIVDSAADFPDSALKVDAMVVNSLLLESEKTASSV